MKENEMAGAIQRVLEAVADADPRDIMLADVATLEDAEALHGASLASFKDAAVMTSNAGFTMKCGDGTEWQISVVRSR